MNDNFGQPLEVGDKVAFMSAGSLLKGKVYKFTDKKVVCLWCMGDNWEEREPSAINLYVVDPHKVIKMTVSTPYE